MTETVAITASLNRETAALVDRAAAARGLSVEDYIAKSLRRVAESDVDFQAFLQVGVDAIERGDVVPHERVMEELNARIAAHRRRCDG